MESLVKNQKYITSYAVISTDKNDKRFSVGTTTSRVTVKEIENNLIGTFINDGRPFGKWLTENKKRNTPLRVINVKVNPVSDAKTISAVRYKLRKEIAIDMVSNGYIPVSGLHKTNNEQIT